MNDALRIMAQKAIDSNPENAGIIEFALSSALEGDETVKVSFIELLKRLKKQ